MRTFTKLIFTAGVAALLLAQSTKIKETQIAVPAATSATVRVLTPTGWQKIRFDLNGIATDFEKKMERAGLSRAERDAIAHQKGIGRSKGPRHRLGSPADL